MPRIEEVRNILEDIRERLERLWNKTDDRRETTPEILREFSDFRAGILDEIISDLKDSEKHLLEIEEGLEEENE